MKWEQLDKYETVKTWLDLSDPRPNTRRNYLTGLQEYVDHTGLNPDELIADADKEVRAGILARDRTLKKRLISYRKHLKEKGLAVNTRRSHMSGVRSFYKAFDHEIPNIGREEKALSKPEHLDIPNKEDIREALKVCDPRDTALILCGCSSGLGAADIVNLTVEQFLKGYDPETEITTLFLRREKSGTDFVTFISPEASQAVHKYLQYRNRDAKTPDKYREMQLSKQKVYGNKGYLFIKRSVSDEYLETHNEELRKLDTVGLLKAYRTLSERAQKSTEKGVWNLIRSHNMRKFFNTTLKNAGFDSERVEFFMGHTLDGTKGAYYRAEAEKLQALYAAFVPYLTIQKELDVASSPEYQKLAAENTDLKAAKESYIVERGELETLAKELEDIKASLRQEQEELWYREENGRTRIAPIGLDNWANMRTMQNRLGKRYSGQELEMRMRAEIDAYIDREVASEAAKVQHDKHRKLKMLF